MDQGLIGLAFAAGLVAALNPCGFAMLPAYLLLVVRGQQSGERSGAPVGLASVGRALAATVGMGLGFLTVFGVFGALTDIGGLDGAAISAVRNGGNRTCACRAWGLVAVGSEVDGIDASAARPAMGAARVRLGSMYGYGVSYAIASLSCTIGPFLAVTAAGVRGGSIVTGVSIYLAYVAGLTLVVGVLAIAAATTSSALADRVRRILPFVNRISGALLVLVGLYVAYYGRLRAAAVQYRGESAGCRHYRGRSPARHAGRLGAPTRCMAVGGALFVLAVGVVGSAWHRRAQS